MACTQKGCQSFLDLNPWVPGVDNADTIPFEKCYSKGYRIARSERGGTLTC
jgi:hypothetical protein